jgi:hypothetical protein
MLPILNGFSINSSALSLTTVEVTPAIIFE